MKSKRKIQVKKKKKNFSIIITSRNVFIFHWELFICLYLSVTFSTSTSSPTIENIHQQSANKTPPKHCAQNGLIARLLFDTEISPPRVLNLIETHSTYARRTAAGPVVLLNERLFGWLLPTVYPHTGNTNNEKKKIIIKNKKQKNRNLEDILFCGHAVLVKDRRGRGESKSN